MRRANLQRTVIALMAASFGTPSISSSNYNSNTIIDPEFFSPPALAREIVINGTPQGPGWFSAAGQQVMIDFAVSENSNLRCERRVVRASAQFCLMSTRSTKTVNDTVEIDLDSALFKSTALNSNSQAPVIPELKTGNVGFVNYNIGGFRVAGANSFSGGLAGGLRFGNNAIDVGGTVTRSATLTSSQASNGNELLSLRDGKTVAILTDAAYRRNWFDRRLSLAIGRTTLQERGLIPSSTFDGIGLSKANVDNQGFIQASRPRGLSGYLPVPGILTYRIGSTVYRQVPLPAGPYTIDLSVFDGLPPGGNIEIIGIDGRSVSLDVPFYTYRQIPLFKEGSLEWSTNAGRIQTRSGYFVPAVTGGFRYGLTSEITVEMAGLLDKGSRTLNLGFDSRLPFEMGLAGIAWAFQHRDVPSNLSHEGLTAKGWALRGYYDKQITEKIAVGADYIRNASGGIFSGGYEKYKDSTIARQADFGSLVQQDLRANIRVPLFDSGLSATLRFSNTSYVTQPQKANYTDVQLSGGFGRYGSWGVFARSGTNGHGAKERSVNIFWSIPIEGTAQATLSYQSTNLDGKKPVADRSFATLSGSRDNGWNQADSYNVSVSNSGEAQANYQYESDRASVSASGYKLVDGSVLGSASVRGSVAYADSSLVLGRSTGSSILVVKAPNLPNEGVFQELNLKPTTVTDSSGNAILPNLRPYQALRAHVDAQNGPIGLEVPENILIGAIHPYRGYIVAVDTHLAHPVRVFMLAPRNLKGVPMNADVMGLVAPVEDDGSIYIEDIKRVQKDIQIFWRLGDQELNCTMSQGDIKSRMADAIKLNGIPQIRDVVCR